MKKSSLSRKRRFDAVIPEDWKHKYNLKVEDSEWDQFKLLVLKNIELGMALISLLRRFNSTYKSRPVLPGTIEKYFKEYLPELKKRPIQEVKSNNT